MGALLIHVQLAFHQCPLVLFGRAVLYPYILQHVLLVGVATNQVQDIVLGFPEPHEILLGPLLSLSRSVWMASHPLGMLTTLHSLVLVWFSWWAAWTMLQHTLFYKSRELKHDLLLL